MSSSHVFNDDDFDYEHDVAPTSEDHLAAEEVSLLENSLTEPEPVISKMNLTLDMLSKPLDEISEDIALSIYENVQSLGNFKYDNKRILRETGSLILLSALFKQYIKHSSIAIEGCKALSVMCVNENDNKRTFGTNGACQDVLKCMDIHIDNYDVLEHCLALIVDLCNSTVLTRQVVVAKSIKQSFVNVPSSTTNCMEFSTCNNRLNFHNANICSILCTLLDTETERLVLSLDSFGDKNEAARHSAVICLVCKAVYTLSEHNTLAQTFGEAGLCTLLTALLKLTLSTDIISAVSYTIVVLCSDTKTGNKQRFNSIDSIKEIIRNLVEYTENTDIYIKLPNFHMLMERCFWSLLSLTQNCPPNVRQLQDNKHTRDVLDAAMGSYDFAESSKNKARTLYKRVFQ